MRGHRSGAGESRLTRQRAGTFARRATMTVTAMLVGMSLQTAAAAAAGAPAALPTLTVGAASSGPAISVSKLQRVDETGSFTSDVLTITERGRHYVVHTMHYEIQASNTGDEPLTLSLDDPRCDPNTTQGPSQVSGTLTGDVLAPGGVAQYTCTHALFKSDPATFTNTATVTGTASSGAAVSGTSSVIVKKRSIGTAVKVCRTPSGRFVRYHGSRLPRACQRHQHQQRHRNHRRRHHHHHHHHRASHRARHQRGLTG
ncbi:MAG: hypothetical protein ACJ764_07920 [Solirubrobacteraceae bacterium]